MKGFPYVYFCAFIYCFSAIEAHSGFLGIPSPIASGLIIIFPILTFVLLKQEIMKENHLYSFSILILSIALMIGNFAQVYEEVGLYDPNEKIVHDTVQSIYFSMVTWTTLGYGDFKPVPSIRLYAATEALFGYVYLGVLIGFVSNWLFTKRKNNDCE